MARAQEEIDETSGLPRKELGNRDLSICQIRPMFNSQCSILTRGSGYADRRSARLTASFRGHQDSTGQYKGDQNGEICVGAWCVRWSMDLGLADGSSEGGGTFGGSIRSAWLGGRPHTCERDHVGHLCGAAV